MSKAKLIALKDMLEMGQEVLPHLFNFFRFNECKKVLYILLPII